MIERFADFVKNVRTVEFYNVETGEILEKRKISKIWVEQGDKKAIVYDAEKEDKKEDA